MSGSTPSEAEKNSNLLPNIDMNGRKEEGHLRSVTSNRVGAISTPSSQSWSELIDRRSMIEEKEVSGTWVSEDDVHSFPRR